MGNDAAPRPLRPTFTTKKVRSGCGIFLLIGLACLSGYLWYGSTTTARLRSRSIPALPWRAQELGSNHGGFFAQWLLVAAQLSNDDFESYRSAIKEISDESFQIPNEARFEVIEKVDLEKPNESAQRIFYKEKVSGSYFPWWTTEFIRNGQIFRKDLGGECHYTIAFDNERKLVFIYWSYS